jgi:glycosyltransferase involved in cell wall biosynthesis
MERIDIIHTHGFGAGLWGRIAAWIARVPIIIVHEHGKTLWKKKQHHLFERIAAKFTQLRIAVSQDILNLRIKNERTPADKICFIPNGVNLHCYRTDGKDNIKKQLGISHFKFVIGTVGRLVPAKAYHVLIDAFTSIDSQNLPACLLFIGDGELRNDLQSYAEKKQVSDKIFFLGARDDIPRLLSVMDVFVISSDREGLPVAMLEAMANKIPVVATAVGGIPEVINPGQNGVLVPPRDAQKLAEELIAILRNPARRQSIAEAGFHTVRDNYSIETIASQIEEIYLHFAKQKLSLHA